MRETICRERQSGKLSVRYWHKQAPPGDLWELQPGVSFQLNADVSAIVLETTRVVTNLGSLLPWRGH